MLKYLTFSFLKGELHFPKNDICRETKTIWHSRSPRSVSIWHGNQIVPLGMEKRCLNGGASQLLPWQPRHYLLTMMHPQCTQTWLEAHVGCFDLSQISWSDAALIESALLLTSLVRDPMSLEISWVYPLSTATQGDTFPFLFLTLVRLSQSRIDLYMVSYLCRLNMRA